MFITTARVVAVIATMTAAVLPAFAQAEVVNSVSVYAQSGGNSSYAESKNLYMGTSSASVDIVTIINGETVVDIHERTDGTPIKIERTTTSNGGNHTIFTTDHLLETYQKEPVEDPAPIESHGAHVAQSDTTAEIDQSAAVAAPLSTIITSEHDRPADDTETGETLSFVSIVEAFTRSITYVLSTLFI